MLTLVAEHCHTTGQAVGEIPLQPEDLVEISNMRQGREVRDDCNCAQINCRSYQSELKGQ